MVLRIVFAALCFSLIPVLARGGEQAAAGIVEKTGSIVSGDISFLDETGRRVALREMTDMPVVVSLVYYGCGGICPRILGNLAAAAGDTDLMPGADYRLLTVSFDQRDTPEDAALMKRNFTAAIGRPVPDDAWRFLTGGEGQIRRFTDALGYSFRRAGKGFLHQRIIIVLSPGGRVVRYLSSPRPDDLKMAVKEAAGSSLSSYCFSYDRGAGRYVFNTGRVLASLFAFGAGCCAVLAVHNRRRTEVRDAF